MIKVYQLLIFSLLWQLLSLKSLYAQAPEYLWARQSLSIGTSGNINEFGQSVMTDALGNTFVTGYFFNKITIGTDTLTSFGNTDIFIAKYNAQGTFQWVRQAGGSGNDYGYGVDVDLQGNVYVTGSYQASATFISPTLSISVNNNGSNSNDVFNAKYTTTGDLLWVGNGGGGGTKISYAIAVDDAGNSYLTGYFSSANTSFGGIAVKQYGGFDLFVVKYNPLGQVEWAQSAGSSGIINDQGKSIAVDGAGNIYITGFFRGTAEFGNNISITSNGNNDDIFVAKYSNAGTVQWARMAGGTNHESGLGISADNLANVYVTGSFVGTASFSGTSINAGNNNRNIFIAKYTTAGALDWVRQAGGSGEDIGQGIGVDGVGNTFVTGYFNGTAIFSDGGVSASLASSGGSDIFLAKYNSSGVLQWAQRAGGTGNDIGYGIFMDGPGNAYVTGTFTGTATFGSTQLTTRTSSLTSMFVTRLGIPSVWTGDVSTSWTNPGNWSNNTVPTSSIHAIIPAGRVNYPVINTAVQAYNVTVQDGATFLTLAPGGSLTVFGAFGFGKDASLIVASDGESTINLRGPFINQGGRFNFGTGTIRFISQGAVSIPTLSYHHLVLEGIAGTTLTLAGPTTINGNLTLANSGFTLVNNQTVTVKGNLTVNAPMTGSGRFVLSGGTATHQIAASQSIPRLELNDERGAIHTTDLTVTDLLTITKGNLSNQANNQLFLNGSLDTSPGSSEDIGRMYIGRLVKKQLINNVGKFNFGNIGLLFDNKGGGNWGEVTITRFTGADASVANPHNSSKQSILRRWDISPVTQAGQLVELTMSWLPTENNNNDFPIKEAYVWKSIDKGESWLLVESPILPVKDKNMLSVGVQTKSFSSWTLSDKDNSVGNISPLPVSWLYFTGKTTGVGVELRWATTSEDNSKYFEVERSEEGSSFVAIGSVLSAGNGEQGMSYSYVDHSFHHLNARQVYYRIKQIDKDDKFSYSSVIVVENASSLKEIAVYPNPFEEVLMVKMPQGERAGKGRILLSTMQGKSLYQKEILNPSLVQIELTDLPALPAGMYLLHVLQDTQSTVLRVVKQK